MLLFLVYRTSILGGENGSEGASIRNRLDEKITLPRQRKGCRTFQDWRS